MRRDAVLRLADAASDLSSSQDRWLEQLCGLLAEVRPKTLATIGWTYVEREGQREQTASVRSGTALPDDFSFETLRGFGKLSSEAGYVPQATVNTARLIEGGELPPERAEAYGRIGVRDGIGVMASIHDGSGLALCSTEARVIPAQVARDLSALRHALTSSLALRRALSGRSVEHVASAAFDTEGRCEHLSDRRLEGELGRLGGLVREREAARSAVERSDDGCALSLWAKLSAGQLWLLDQYDSSGKRTVVLTPVLEGCWSMRALSPVEARIARMAGQARSTKEIAYALKISESAAENHLSRVMRKLGVRDRMALVTLYTQLEHAGHA